MRMIVPTALAGWLLSAVATAGEFGGKIVVGYAVAGRPQVFKDPAMREFAFDRVTHVVLMGGVQFDKDGVVTVDKNVVAEPVAVTHAKQRKISVVFAGPYATVFAIPKARETLITGVIDACTKHGFDGADFDYEYPETMQQRADFETFLIDLRAAAPRGMLISVAVSAWGADKHLVPAAAAPALDWVFLMGYGPTPAGMTLESSARQLQNCIDWGVPPEKMVLGMPIYGSNGTDGPGYADLLGSKVPDRTADEHNGWHFNGPATIEKKTRHAVEKNAAGVGWWYVGLDCQDERSVMEAAVQALRGAAAKP